MIRIFTIEPQPQPKVGQCPSGWTIAIVLIVTLVSPVRAEPQTRTFYNTRGQVTGHATTRGNTTILADHSLIEVAQEDHRAGAASAQKGVAGGGCLKPSN
jgi:hypothetical protein